MAEFATLIRTQRLLGEGASCQFGCDDSQLPEIIAYAKHTFPNKPYCVVTNWTWVDIAASDLETDTAGPVPGKQSILYAGRIIADEAHRPNLGPLVRTSPLCEFHLNCVFVTRNTVYILCGGGKRTTVSSGLIDGHNKT